MNSIFWPTILAQVSPATGGSTPTGSPLPTPPSIMHLIFNHSYSLGDIATLFIISVLLIILGLIVGAFFQKGGTEGLTKFFGDFTNVLAYVVVVFAFIGIFWLARAVLGAKDDHSLENVKYVFAAVLPLLGTWVGTVLAHYFQKENLAAATQSITSLASKVAGTDKLQSTLAKDVMIKPDQIETLPDNYLNQKMTDVNAKASLSELSDHLKDVSKDRLPLFTDNQEKPEDRTYQKKGAPAGVVHQSTINSFIQAYTSLPNSPDKKDPKDLTLGDLVSDTKCNYKSVFDNSFGVVAEDSTLGRAKAVMDSIDQKIPSGIKENCCNIFVTKTGDIKEPVLGLVTNDVINANAKV